MESRWPLRRVKVRIVPIARRTSTARARRDGSDRSRRMPDTHCPRSYSDPSGGRSGCTAGRSRLSCFSFSASTLWPAGSWAWPTRTREARFPRRWPKGHSAEFGVLPLHYRANSRSQSPYPNASRNRPVPFRITRTSASDNRLLHDRSIWILDGQRILISFPRT